MSIGILKMLNLKNFFQGVVTAATRGPLESTTKIVPGAVTFQNTEAMTKVRSLGLGLTIIVSLRAIYFQYFRFTFTDVQRKSSRDSGLYHRRTSFISPSKQWMAIHCSQYQAILLY